MLFALSLDRLYDLAVIVILYRRWLSTTFLKVREASQRKSLQGLDDTSADGAEGFRRIIRIVDDLEEQYGVSIEWCSDVRKGLQKAKRSLKKEFSVHCREGEGACADHSRTFALSDPADDDFKHQCLHVQTVKCESCTDLTNVLQSVEEKINELSSMYNIEKHKDLIPLINLSTPLKNGNVIFIVPKTKRRQSKALCKILRKIQFS